ncbi:SNF2 family N-terminal domain-containing protein [Xylariaceae sp. FL0016]|nr:SNF2 family N-terminal domain-containing protein [Xylariaceae sp. FL0016]
MSIMASTTASDLEKIKLADGSYYISESEYNYHFIPLGCVIVPQNEVSKVLDCEKNLELCRRGVWKYICRRKDQLLPTLCVSSKVANDFLSSDTLKQFSVLWRLNHIHLSLAIFSKQPFSSLDPDPTPEARFRVYIRPQDATGPVSSEYNRALERLLKKLEFSKQCWDGDLEFPAQCHPTKTHDAQPEQRWLLSIFNDIPSPYPLLEALSDPVGQKVMQDLLDSKVIGLSTELYAHQRRSAALMAQRELESRRVLDPRMVSCLDQSGGEWYYDSASPAIYRKRKEYDSCRGGILAEEMGTGKTLICLALILSTKGQPTIAPEPYTAEIAYSSTRSLLDMAAATANKHSVPWKVDFDALEAQSGLEYRNCIAALSSLKNRAYYTALTSNVELRRSGRTAPQDLPPKRVWLSYTTLIVVPNNLVTQWLTEIGKHTLGLKVCKLIDKDLIPSIDELLSYDILLVSVSRLERLQRERAVGHNQNHLATNSLEHIHFKRCIVDEGHRLGNGSPSRKSDVMRALEHFETAARWVVTGTPSQGLYGVDFQIPKSVFDGPISSYEELESFRNTMPQVHKHAMTTQKDDVVRLGNIITQYLRIRPWCNARGEVGDHPANWNQYVLPQAEQSNGLDRRDCLASTLESLVVRHRLSDINVLLPSVEEKIVVLDGCFQDQLSLNLFSMFITMNSVMTEREGEDYFFSKRQRKAILQLVRNMKQASFFGGVFYSSKDIERALEVTRIYMKGHSEDHVLSGDPSKLSDANCLKEAFEFGQMALRNSLRKVSNETHTLPLYVEDFPGQGGKHWSLEGSETRPGLVCMDASLIGSLQTYLWPALNAPSSIQMLIDSGRLDCQGKAAKGRLLNSATKGSGRKGQPEQQIHLSYQKVHIGIEHHEKPRSGRPKEDQTLGNSAPESMALAEPLAKTRIISTASAKLTYLLESILEHQDDEQIIVFYDNENVAWHLAGALEVLHVEHLIYSRAGLNPQQRAGYVDAFNTNSKYRVLLMDLAQAAFGLDMRTVSRIYFVAPVLNPQVQAQAIGRARRVNQNRPVTVETIVLKNSIDEIIVQRRQDMRAIEHRKVKDVLDDACIYDWIKNAKICPMTDIQDSVLQTATLKEPRYVFGPGGKQPIVSKRTGPYEDSEDTPLPARPEKRSRLGVTFG